MKKLLLLVPILLLLDSGCMVAPRRGGGLEVIPALPAVVEIGPDAYYAYGGCHYFYDQDRCSTLPPGSRVPTPRGNDGCPCPWRTASVPPFQGRPS